MLDEATVAGRLGEVMGFRTLKLLVIIAGHASTKAESQRTPHCPSYSSNSDAMGPIRRFSYHDMRRGLQLLFLARNSPENLGANSSISAEIPCEPIPLN